MTDWHPLAQYVWHPYYVDALAVRYYDADTDNNLSENNDGALYYCHDANFNVTAITNASGTVLQRYQYSPYGQVTSLAPNFTAGGTATENTHLYTGRERDGETGPRGHVYYIRGLYELKKICIFYMVGMRALFFIHTQRAHIRRGGNCGI